MEPIFHPSSETETIANKLSTYSSITQDDFSKFVDMIYKFIIESSSYGAKLPNEPRVDSMRATIKELRNHFFHDREFGKPGEAKKKFIKVGDIYEVFIGKRAPEENDWLLLQNALLKEIRIGLQQLAASPTIRNPQNEESDAPWNKKFEDNSVFILGCKPSPSRILKKRGYLSQLADIPVFIPDFTLVPPPHIGNTKNAVYITSAPAFTGTVDNFARCVQELEEIWLKNDFLLETFSPFSWSVAEDNSFSFGFGSNNLIKKVKNTARGTIGAIMQGCFREHFDRTCFLVLYAYRKGESVDVGADLYLSCIPTNFDWFEKLYSKAFQSFVKCGTKINFYSIEPMRLLEWKSIRHRIKPKILGGIRRRGYGSSKENRETDQYSGVIIKNTNIRSSDYHLVRSWNLDDIKDEIEMPLKLLDESVISITNTVPYCDEVDSGKILDLCAPHVTMFLFDGHGADIYAIAVHSTGPRIT